MSLWSKPKPKRVRKRSPEWQRGAKFGRDAACEMAVKHGYAFAEHGARDLAAAARKRDATDFDRGYARAYAEALRSGTCRR